MTSIRQELRDELNKWMRAKETRDKQIGDWIDNDALERLKQDEELLCEQHLCQDTFRNYLEQRLVQLSQELELLKRLVVHYNLSLARNYTIKC